MSEELTEEEYKKLAEIGIFAFELFGQWSEKNGFSKSDTLHFGTEQDAINSARLLVEGWESLLESEEIDWYRLTLRRTLPTSEFVAGWESGKQRVAHPDHRIFICVSGTDCDGMRWKQFLSFETLEEAAEEVDNILRSADGPTGYYSMSETQWEEAEYPEYRDRYAEQMGY